MKNLFIIFLFFAITSCTYDSNKATNPQEITPTLIGKGELYGNGEENISQQNIVITNQTDWTNLKNQVDGVNNVSPSFTEQNIDFDVYQLLVVFDQIRATGGFSIEIETITENENSIDATIQTTSSGEIATMVITQPYHIVKIPKSTKPVVFQ